MGRERESYTLHLGNWYNRELRELGKMLIAYADGKHPQAFDSDYDLIADFNPNSGNVYLWSEDWSACLLYREYTKENANAPTEELYPIYNSPYEGREGDWEELSDEFFDMHKEDKEWFLTLPEFDSASFSKVVGAGSPDELEDAWPLIAEFYNKEQDSFEHKELINAIEADWDKYSEYLQQDIYDFMEYNSIDDSFPHLIVKSDEEDEEAEEKTEDETNTESGGQSSDSTGEHDEDSI